MIVLLLVFSLLTFPNIRALNPAAYYPVLQQLDSLWGLNYTNAFGPSNISCNCSNSCLWRTGISGFTCSGGMITSISFNYPLTGTLPSELGILGSVTTLILRDTNLAGGIPSEIQNINTLYLSNNQFAGTLPILNSQIVYVDNNQLSGNLPSLPNIVQLNIKNNQFTGGLENIGNTLRSLDLSNNQFTGLFPSLNYLILNSLNLANNSFIGPINSGLATCIFPMGGCNLDLNYFDNCNISPLVINNNCTTSCKPSSCPGNKPNILAICVDGQWQLVGNIIIEILKVDSDILVTGNLTLENDSQLIISNGVITVTGYTILNGELIIKTNNTRPKIIFQNGNITGNFNKIKLSLRDCYQGEGITDGNAFIVFVVNKCNKTSRRIIVAVVISVFIFVALLIILISLVIYKYCPQKMHLIDRTAVELPGWR